MGACVEKTGKTIEEARQAALEELGAAPEEVTVEILEEPSKGFLGIIGGHEAKIRVTVIDKSPADLAQEFLKKIFTSMGLDVTLEKENREDAIVFNLVGKNLGILIGKHGQTLDALQYLVNLVANKGRVEDRLHIILDIEKYRERREDTLRHLAMRLAEKVGRSGREIVLEPMNRHERKVIHMALQEDERVHTKSVGEEPFRKVVIEANRPKR